MKQSEEEIRKDILESLGEIDRDELEALVAEELMCQELYSYIGDGDVDMEEFLEAFCGDELNETLSVNKSLKDHHGKHTLKPGAQRKSDTRAKYDSMTRDEYYNYAMDICTLTPDITIKSRQIPKEDLEVIISDFVNGPIQVIKIDCGLRNKNDGHLMYAIFNRKSKYHPVNYDVALWDKQTEGPITIFSIAPSNALTRASKLIYED